MGEGTGSGGGSRGGGQPSAAQLAAALGAWPRDRPFVMPERQRDYPVPPFEPDPTDDVAARFLERLEYERQLNEFMEQLSKTRRRDA